MSEDYPFSKVTKKIQTLLEKELMVQFSKEDMLFIEEAVQDSCLDDNCSETVKTFLNVLTSGKEHPEPIILKEGIAHLFEVFYVLKERFDLNFCDYGEFTFWHLPNWEYALWIQYEALKPSYYTKKELLSYSYKSAMKNY